MMGQMLNTFFPNREKPAISPISTMVKPLKGSLASLMMRMEMMVTSPALTKAAAGPAMWI
jgi:hypothetical protein